MDVFAANAITGEIFGEGGGDEARRSEFLSGLRKQYGKRRGDRDVRRLHRVRRRRLAGDDEQAPSATAARRAPAPATSCSTRARSSPPARRGWRGPRRSRTGRATSCSSAPKRSATGHPLFVGGPQIGYTYPGLTLEADISWPGGQARGATAPGFAGNILIGRGQDYAWSLTSAGSDLVDTYVETLCGGSKTKYRYKGRCRTMGRVDAGTIKEYGRVVYRTTVHGPVTGYAKVDGRAVAVSRKRASFGQDVLWQLGFRELTVGSVRSAKTFRAALASSPFTFNVGYADDRDIAMYSAGKLPVRPRGVDPRLPVKGTGEYEWRGYLRQSRRPFQANPPSGLLVNWNNRPAPGWGAADDNWTYGSTQRVQLLDGRARQARHARPRVGHERDERGRDAGPAQRDAHAGDRAPARAYPAAATPRAARMLELLGGWRAAGSSRLDRDLDGVIDAGPAPAIWDAFYPRLWAAAMPVKGLGRSSARTPAPRATSPTAASGTSRRTSAGSIGIPFRDPFKERYCGGGDAARCAAAIWEALDAVPGDPDALRADATRSASRSGPGLLPTTIRYTNRPSGIQQVISFDRHRPR